MTIIRAKRVSRDFTIISNSVCLDSRLSMRALGLLVRLLSRPDDWSTNSQTLAREFDVGREQMQGVLRELAEAGYMRLVKNRQADGTIHSQWYVYDEPLTGEPAPENQRLETRMPAAQAPLTRTDLPSTDTNSPVAPKGASSWAAAPSKKTRAKGAKVAFSEWLKAETDAGRAFIPGDDPIFSWAGKARLSSEHIELAIEFFSDRYTNERVDAKYVDWRAAFRDHVKLNYLKLWYRNSAGEWVLSVVGHQAAEVFGAGNE